MPRRICFTLHHGRHRRRLLLVHTVGSCSLSSWTSPQASRCSGQALRAVTLSVVTCSTCRVHRMRLCVRLRTRQAPASFTQPLTVAFRSLLAASRLTTNPCRIFFAQVLGRRSEAARYRPEHVPSACGGEAQKRCVVATVVPAFSHRERATSRRRNAC